MALISWRLLLLSICFFSLGYGYLIYNTLLGYFWWVFSLLSWLGSLFVGVKRLPCQLNLSSFFNFNGNLISGVNARGLACLSALVFPGLFEVFAIVSDLFCLIGYFTHVERSCLSILSLSLYIKTIFFLRHTSFFSLSTWQSTPTSNFKALTFLFYRTFQLWTSHFSSCHLNHENVPSLAFYPCKNAHVFLPSSPHFPFFYFHPHNHQLLEALRNRSSSQRRGALQSTENRK